MQGALDFLNKLFDKLLTLFPARVIIKATEGGVAFKWGKAKALKPGTHVYWPFWTEVVVQPVVRQTLDLPAQSLMAGDKAICVSATVVYEIPDLYAALTKLHDYDEAVSDLSRATVKEVLWGKSMADICRDDRAIGVTLRQELAKKLRPFGLKIHNVFISDLSTCIVIRSLGSDSVTYVPAAD